MVCSFMFLLVPSAFILFIMHSLYSFSFCIHISFQVASSVASLFFSFLRPLIYCLFFCTFFQDASSQFQTRFSCFRPCCIEKHSPFLCPRNIGVFVLVMLVDGSRRLKICLIASQHHIKRDSQSDGACV